MYSLCYLFGLFKWAHPICVFGDDHVTCYMGADVDASEHADA